MTPLAPEITTAGFSDNLPYRSQQGKRKPAGPLPCESNGSPPADLANVEEDVDDYFAQNTKSDEGLHAAKGRRVNEPSEKIKHFRNVGGGLLGAHGIRLSTSVTERP